MCRTFYRGRAAHQRKRSLTSVEVFYVSPDRSHIRRIGGRRARRLFECTCCGTVFTLLRSFRFERANLRADASRHRFSVGVVPSDVAMANSGVVERVHFMPTRLRSSISSQPSAASIGYPLDMTDGGGPKMSSAEAYNVYVNCKDERCWGHPEEFLKGLAGSTLAGLITQYTGGAPTAYRFKGASQCRIRTHTRKRTIAKICSPS